MITGFFRLISLIITTTISTIGGVLKFTLGFVLVILILLLLLVFGLLHLLW